MIWKKELMSVKGRKEEGRRNPYVGIKRSGDVDLVLVGIKVGMTPQVTSDHKLGEHLIDHGIGRVLDDTEDIESRQDGLGEFDVLTERDRRIVAPSNRIRGGDDGTTGLESRHDTGFRDGDRLLFHGFVD